MVRLVRWLVVPVLAWACGAPAEESGVEVSGGVTATALAAEGGRADPTLAGSFDLVLEGRAGPGAWVLYVEGSSSVNQGSVADRYPAANADAGTALAADGRAGTVQVSELKYRYEPGAGRTITAGVLDLAGYMDLSNTANDENTQFLNAALVNNAVIGFPDYTPGMVFEHEVESVRWFALFASSHGIAENGGSWTGLLEVDAPGKGAFAAAGARAAGEIWGLELGAWGNSADHPGLDGTRSGEPNYGAYAVAGAARGGMAFDLRLGYANPEVSEASLFSSASLGFELDGAALGLGYARSALADDAKAPGRDAENVAEIYLRLPWQAVEVTFDLQFLENPGFDATAPDTRVGGVRVHYGW